MPILNGVLFQYFHWHYKNDGTLWREIAATARELHRIGITSVWLPPAYKGQAGVVDTGYGVYDLYDLGEFDQKKTVRTKYGSKAELLEAIKALHEQGMEVYADFVLNHRCGTDATEIIDIVEVDANDRTKLVPGQKHQVHRPHRPLARHPDHRRRRQSRVHLPARQPVHLGARVKTGQTNVDLQDRRAMSRAQSKRDLCPH